jgi:hypothetical protein
MHKTEAKREKEVEIFRNKPIQRTKSMKTNI